MDEHGGAEKKKTRSPRPTWAAATAACGLFRFTIASCAKWSRCRKSTRYPTPMRHNSTYIIGCENPGGIGDKERVVIADGSRLSRGGGGGCGMAGG